MTTATTVLVGWLPDDSGRDALALAARMASTSDSVSVQACTVLPRAWSFPATAKVDAEYGAWLDEQGSAAAAQARSAMAEVLQPEQVGDPDAVFTSDSAESAGLSAVAGKAGGRSQSVESGGADVVALGSSGGDEGRFTSGSTTDALLHSSSIPLALAPRGTRRSITPFTSIVCAYAGTPESRGVVDYAASLAEQWGVGLRLVAFAPRRATTFPPVGGYDAEDVVAAGWRDQAASLLDSACAEIRSDHPRLDPQAAVGTGGDWQQVMSSLDPDRGDLLVLGSSRLGPIARVFLGSTASKIVRHSAVPMIVVPRGSRAGR